MQEISIVSSLDGSSQPSLFLPATGEAPRPLLVGLHTWSSNRFNQVEPLQPLAEERNWNLLLPDFRGPNLESNEKGQEACGSPLARQDILDAVTHVQQNYSVSDSIFLLGGSGGGHMSLMMAAERPDLWTAISSWCPITDLRNWRLENERYRAHIEHCCGGVPEDSDAIAKDYANRSPISYIDRIAQSNLYILHGKYDASVPFTHTLNLYTQLSAAHPDATVYCDIFPGKHDYFPEQALVWFDSFLADGAPGGRELTG